MAAGTRCVGGELEGEMADQAGWIESVTRKAREKEGGRRGERGRKREKATRVR